jgi:glycosyltransferase involved in cell wall biosynthesis
MDCERRSLVSVVTPVYNGAEFLQECIESVLAQTYPCWHYVIVDNCSTDRTFEIASEYARKDSRITVRRNERFVGAVANYNNALRQTSPRSEFCKIVAADDWLFPTCLEQMVALAEAHPGVGIVGAYQLGLGTMAADGLRYPASVISGREAARMQLLGGPYVLGTPTSVLFRSTLVRSRHAFYNESNPHFDDEGCVEFLEHHDFGFVHQVLSFRREHEGSLTSYSDRINTYTPALLLLLLKHGSKYLSASELEVRIREVVGEYYAYLGKELLKGRDAEFWRYHRGKLRELGYPLRPTRVAFSALTAAIDLLLNPKSSCELALKKLRARSAKRTAHACRRGSLASA